MRVMKKDCLNNCLFPHCHQSITDKSNTVLRHRKEVGLCKRRTQKTLFFCKTRLEASTGLWWASPLYLWKPFAASFKIWPKTIVLFFFPLTIKLNYELTDDFYRGIVDEASSHSNIYLNPLQTLWKRKDDRERHFNLLPTAHCQATQYIKQNR